MNNNTSYWKRFKSNLSLAPIEFKVFVVFSFIETAISLCLQIFGSKQLKESIIPTTGWLFFMPYLVTSLTVASQLSGNIIISGRARSRYFNIGFLAFYMLIMTIEALITSGNDYNNPYLMISPWRPVWTIVLPAIWILVLLSPRIKRYYELINIES